MLQDCIWRNEHLVITSMIELKLFAVTSPSPIFCCIGLHHTWFVLIFQRWFISFTHFEYCYKKIKINFKMGSGFLFLKRYGLTHYCVKYRKYQKKLFRNNKTKDYHATLQQKWQTPMLHGQLYALLHIIEFDNDELKSTGIKLNANPEATFGIRIWQLCWYASSKYTF